MKTKIYKVPFAVATKENRNYILINKGMVVVRRNILGDAKEIITEFNNFFYTESPFQGISNNEDAKYILHDTKSHSFKETIKRDTFALTIDKKDFADKNLATLKDIEEWEKNFYGSEFYRYYQQMNIIPKEKQKAINVKVMSLRNK